MSSPGDSYVHTEVWKLLKDVFFQSIGNSTIIHVSENLLIYKIIKIRGLKKIFF